MYVYLFDIDGTLLKSGGAGKAAMIEALREVFGATANLDGIPISGRTDKSICGDAFAACRIESTEQNMALFQEAYFEKLPGCLDTYNGHVLPGVEQLLKRLDGPDIIVGLLTGNFRQGARIKLAHFNLDHHFSFGGFGDHHFSRNDVAREAIKAVQAQLNGDFNLDQTWVIGDTPLDIECARAVGVKVAAVKTGWHSHDELAAHSPDLLLNDLVEAMETAPFAGTIKG